MNLSERKKELKNILMLEGITDTKVLKAFEKVPREEFVKEELREYAYLNRPLPIGYDQTISQPFIVTFMTQLLNVNKEDTVLEIGTGCGYQTAILAELAKEVFTIELVPELSVEAQETLKKLGYKNIQFKVGDGKEGWEKFAPFDRIIGTSAPPQLPTDLVDQLALDGIMVIPIGNEAQQLFIIKKSSKGQIDLEPSIPVKFVPML